ncbi:MAG TPA: preprotein translocase subunit SecE [Parvularculaceae bacterium]|nr:preprotein translocase subunit SecE [Parvularculaceae bacterium]
MAKAKKAAGGEVIEGKADEVKPKKKRTNLFEFIGQVRAEMRKVTWTARNEVVVSTVMVLIMVVLMAIFFFIIDMILRFGVCHLLPINCVPLDHQV